jgi:phosphopantothenoylcysteine synthetase/decarboxylase
VVCGAPLASRAQDLTAAAAAAGWEVALTVTSAAQQWTGAAAQEPATRLTDAVLVCPLTFNTANKWALGIADTEWLGVLNESLAAGTPTVAVPMVNETLWRHPAWEGTLGRLASAGLTLVDPSTGDPEPRPVPHRSGDDLADAFDPAWVLRLL